MQRLHGDVQLGVAEGYQSLVARAQGGARGGRHRGRNVEKVDGGRAGWVGGLGRRGGKGSDAFRMQGGFASAFGWQLRFAGSEVIGEGGGRYDIFYISWFFGWKYKYTVLVS